MRLIIILTWTNVKMLDFRAKFMRQARSELKELNMAELNVFLGLLYYSAVLKSNHESSRKIFATDGTGTDMPLEQPSTPKIDSSKRKTCILCLPKLNRMSNRYGCVIV
ncbi:unnamed protein product [Euphydryas editha]|uniref:PiggyBac transposable element-derived protein domain-containing protein n=1 Tax=Euphydryas editha TaxID=104508 RepID=A0AAU9U3Z0_EUPED|nr:unnamed protein product [Euphydryas editha]